MSDSHIGGDRGRDIFESPDDLVDLFEELGSNAGPVELVLAGDFFDFLRTAEVPEAANRASVTIGRAEYRELFAALRRFAAGASRTVVYLPGNHDAEVWWNPAIQEELREQRLVHHFALSYAAAFESDPACLVYCEHGNQFDPPNTIRDYEDGLDTPLGHHVVTELTPRLPERGAAAPLRLRDIDRVFPIALIPLWLGGRAFYDLLTLSLRWLVIPLLVAIAAYEAIAFALGAGDRLLGALLGDLAFEVALVLAGFAVFLAVVRRRVSGALAAGGAAEGGGIPADPTVAGIRAVLERGASAPLEPSLTGEVTVFVSGHTHTPALSEVDREDGRRVVLVNSGCWLRQVHPVAAHLGMPAVYTPSFVQNHVRVHRSAAGTEVELWERPRAFDGRLPLLERIAILGRRPPQPQDRQPRSLARATVECDR